MSIVIKRACRDLSKKSHAKITSFAVEWLDEICMFIIVTAAKKKRKITKRILEGEFINHFQQMKGGK